MKKEKQEEEKDNAPSLEEVDSEEEPSEEGDPSFEPAWYRTKVSQEELKAAGISLAGYSTPTTGEAEIRFQEGSHIAMMLKNLLPCAYGRRVKEAGEDHSTGQAEGGAAQGRLGCHSTIEDRPTDAARTSEGPGRSAHGLNGSSRAK